MWKISEHDTKFLYVMKLVLPKDLEVLIGIINVVSFKWHIVSRFYIGWITYTLVCVNSLSLGLCSTCDHFQTPTHAILIVGSNWKSTHWLVITKHEDCHFNPT
jgi:hypothetical protein